MRVKDLQRVERQNITLSEQNKKLTDSLGELQNQNLSTIAGSGCLFSTSQQLNSSYLENSSRQGTQMPATQLLSSNQHQLGGTSTHH